MDDETKRFTVRVHSARAQISKPCNASNLQSTNWAIAETDPQDREETRKTKPEKLMVYPTCLSLPIKQLIYKQLAGCFEKDHLQNQNFSRMEKN